VDESGNTAVERGDSVTFLRFASHAGAGG